MIARYTLIQFNLQQLFYKTNKSSLCSFLDLESLSFWISSPHPRFKAPYHLSIIYLVLHKRQPFHEYQLLKSTL